MARTWVGFMVVAALAGSASADAPAPEAPLYACRPLPPGAKITASFKPNTSVSDLAIWLQGFTCKNVVFGSDVAATAVGVNIITSRQMTPNQAVQLFVDAVEATGLRVTQKAETVIIKLGPGMKPGCTTTMPAAVVEDPLATTDSPAELEAKAAKGIKIVSATEVHVTRAALDVVLQSPAAFSKGARLVPAALTTSSRRRSAAAR